MSMNPRINRREFVQRAFAAAALPSLAGCVGPRHASGSLPRPTFYWGVGIENGWMAQTDPVKDGKRRLLDVYLQMQHYEKWKEDLALAADLGINAIRYSVPWYRAEPRPGVYDWSWIDQPVAHLVQKLKIIPVMDLIHYGTPAWMADGVGDERFPDAIARYAEAMALHFRGLVNHYTPHNEPQMTCNCCGLGAVTGSWPPYRHDLRSWVQIGVRVARGMVLEMEAIRRALPDAVIVSAETNLPDWMRDFLPPRFKEDAAYQQIRSELARYPAPLAYGKIAADSSVASLLEANGVTREDFDWFRKRGQTPDIIGDNNYPDVGERALRDEDFTRNGAVSVEQGAREAAAKVAQSLRESHDYYQRPVCLTETSAGSTTASRVAYIDALGEMLQSLRRDRVPIVGVNWWPLFSTISFEYRDMPDVPLTDFLKPGFVKHSGTARILEGGLYQIELQPGGDLKRVPTAAVKAYRALVQRSGTRP